MAQLELQVLQGQQVQGQIPFSGPLLIGRQDAGEPEPVSAIDSAEGLRVIIAPALERRVSRYHLRVDPLASGRVRLTNLSENRSVRMSSGQELSKKGDQLELGLPILAIVGSQQVRIRQRGADIATDDFETLASASLPPSADYGKLSSLGRDLSVLTSMPAHAPEVEHLVQWIQAAMAILHSAASSADFFHHAARALVDLVGLDTGAVLLRQDSRWKIEILERKGLARNDQGGWQPSRSILSRLVSEKRTFWKPLPVHEAMESVASLETIVAAPILDGAGQVIGALYGDRGRNTSSGVGPITRMEALLVELLAGGVAAGLARLTHEKAALKAQLQLENFFTPRLARHLAERPELLEGRDATVTVLVCDIRGFSRLSERLGPEITVQWINRVMTELTACILAEEGVVVDYVGDEVMAMWGAPTEQPDQAQRACRTGLAMAARLPDLNREWQKVLAVPISVGIGIHTGPARVGNVGSRYKFKYGPLGHTVNLASRVQGINKYLNTCILVTRSTHELLPPGTPTRRLGKVRVHNIAEAVELVETLDEKDHGLLPDFFAQALDLFEAKEFRPAARILGLLLADFPEDGPTLVLLSRTVQSLVGGPDKDHPIWVLGGK